MALNGHQGVPLQILAYAPPDDEWILVRPCVDCGLLTGRFCDYCYAFERFPNGDADGRGWARGQLTPLCSLCDNERDGCRYCWDLWVTKPVQIYSNYDPSKDNAGARQADRLRNERGSRTS